MVTSTPSADLENCLVSEVSETGTWEQLLYRIPVHF